MSVQDIVKYVKESPINTNPAVIKSMVEEEIRNNGRTSSVQADWEQMDSNSADYVKNRTHYGNRTVLEFDGILEGKETIPMGDGITLVRASNKFLSVNDLIGAECIVNTAGSIMEIIINEDMLEVIEDERGMIQIAVIFNNKIPLIMTTNMDFEGFSPGAAFVYFDMGNDLIIYPESLAFGEIKKLDAKYITGAVNEIAYPLSQLEILQVGKSERYDSEEPYFMKILEQLKYGLVKLKIKYKFRKSTEAEKIEIVLTGNDKYSYCFIEDDNELVLITLFTEGENGFYTLACSIIATKKHTASETSSYYCSPVISGSDKIYGIRVNNDNTLTAFLLN